MQCIKIFADYQNSVIIFVGEYLGFWRSNFDIATPFSASKTRLVIFTRILAKTIQSKGQMGTENEHKENK